MQEIGYPILKSLVVDLYEVYFGQSSGWKRGKDILDLLKELGKSPSGTKPREYAIGVVLRLRNTLAHSVSKEFGFGERNPLPSQEEFASTSSVLFDWYLASLKSNLLGKKRSERAKNRGFEKIFFYGLLVHFSRVLALGFVPRNTFLDVSSQDYLISFLLSCMGQVLQEINSFSGSETDDPPSLNNFRYQLAVLRDYGTDSFLTQAILFLRNFSSKGGKFTELGNACLILISYQTSLSGQDRSFYSLIPRLCFLLQNHAPTLEIPSFLFKVVQRGLDLDVLDRLSADAISPFPLERPKIFDDTLPEFLAQGTFAELKKEYGKLFPPGPKGEGAQLIILDGKYERRRAIFEKWSGTVCRCYLPSLEMSKNFSLKRKAGVVEFAK